MAFKRKLQQAGSIEESLLKGNRYDSAPYLRDIHEIIIHEILLDVQCNLDRLSQVATRSQ